MATFSLDASVTLTWCFEDEATAATDALLKKFTRWRIRHRPLALADRSHERVGGGGAPKAHSS